MPWRCRTHAALYDERTSGPAKPRRGSPCACARLLEGLEAPRARRAPSRAGARSTAAGTGRTSRRRRRVRAGRPWPARPRGRDSPRPSISDDLVTMLGLDLLGRAAARASDLHVATALVADARGEALARSRRCGRRRRGARRFRRHRRPISLPAGGARRWKSPVRASTRISGSRRLMRRGSVCRDVARRRRRRGRRGRPSSTRRSLRSRLATGRFGDLLGLVGRRRRLPFARGS